MDREKTSCIEKFIFTSIFKCPLSICLSSSHSFGSSVTPSEMGIEMLPFVLSLFSRKIAAVPLNLYNRGKCHVLMC